MKTPTLVLTALAVLLALPASAQTDAIPYESTADVHNGHTWLAHAKSDGFHVFSAFSQRFEQIAGPSAVFLRGTPNGLLLQEGIHYLAYSGWRNEVAPAPLARNESVQEWEAHGEVFHLRTSSPDGRQRFLAYSAQTGTWEALDLGRDPLQVTVVHSGLALAVHYHPPGANPLHAIAAFGARKATWDVISDLVDVSFLQVGGNVVAAAVVENVHSRFYAFSAVHNVHALSEDVFEADSLVIHTNVAFGKTFDAVSQWRGSVFSAYDATWVASERLRPLAEEAGLAIARNWVALFDGDDSLDAEAWEVIGARPHDRWVQLDSRAGRVHTTPDILVLDDFSGQLLAFSGVAGDDWRARAATGPFQFSGGPDHFFAVADAAGSVHAFSPLHDAWADPIPAPAGLVDFDTVEAVGSVRGPGVPVQGYAARWNQWVPGPILDNVDHSVPYAADLLYWYDDRADELRIFDGRRNAFVGPFASGPALFALGHQLVAVGDDAVRGYSTHRGVWETYEKPDGPVVLPLMEEPTVVNSVAWFVDGARDLVAVGATNDVEILHNYPESSEYHALAEGGAAVSSTPVTLLIRGEPGDRVRTYYADRRRFSPLNLPMAFTGKGWLLHPVVRLDNHLFGGSEREHHLVIGLPTGSPGSIQVWTQTLNDTASDLPTRFVAGIAPEPLWIF